MRPEAFNRILARVKGHDAEQLVNEVVLRTQAQAEYAAENYGHFGLNLRRYAHFTSPIRRYADLIVHRGLIRALKLGSDGLPESHRHRALAEIAAQISAAERRAMVAERETNDRLIAHFLADRIGATFEGRISGVTRAGLFVKLDDTGADGFIPARTIGDEYFRYDEAAHAMVGIAHRAKPTGSATASPSSWSKRRRSPARCASSFCRKGVRENLATADETNSASSITVRAANNGRHDDERPRQGLGRAHDQIGARPDLA